MRRLRDVDRSAAMERSRSLCGLASGKCCFFLLQFYLRILTDYLMCVCKSCTKLDRVLPFLRTLRFHLLRMTSERNALRCEFELFSLSLSSEQEAKHIQPTYRDPVERPSASELQKHPYLTLQPDWTFNGFK